MKQKKFLTAVFIETCFMLGIVMVAIGVAIFALWKNDQLDLANEYIYMLLIWGFMIAFAGSAYMVFSPVVRHTLNLEVRGYHYPAIFIGLCVMIYTGSTLIRSQMLGIEVFLMLFIPPIMTLVMMMLKHRSGTTAPINPG